MTAPIVQSRFPESNDEFPEIPVLVFFDINHPKTEDLIQGLSDCGASVVAVNTTHPVSQNESIEITKHCKSAILALSAKFKIVIVIEFFQSQSVEKKDRFSLFLGDDKTLDSKLRENINYMYAGPGPKLGFDIVEEPIRRNSPFDSILAPSKGINGVQVAHNNPHQLPADEIVGDLSEIIFVCSAFAIKLAKSTQTRS